jgi:VCBS repeat-containing protein
MNNNIRGYNPPHRVMLAAAATLVFAGIFIFGFLTGVNSVHAIVTEDLIDEVPVGSLSEWTVGNTSGNPIFTYQEIDSPFDSSKAIRTSVVGDTISQCPSQYLLRAYDWGGNTSYTSLKAYLAFTSTMQEYDFPYVYIQLFDAEDNQVGYQVYYGKGVIGGLYAQYAASSPNDYTELSGAEGDMVMDLSRIGSDIDFHHFSIALSNYACIGENSVTFDHLRILNGDNTGNTAPVATSDSFTVEAGESHAGQVAGTDTDGDTLTFEPSALPIHGTLHLNSDGSFTYDADSDYAGDDSFTFRVYDGQQYSAPATVSVTITEPPPAKVIKLLVYNPNVLGPNNEECKGQYGKLPYEYLEANGVEVTFWCNANIVDASVLEDYDALYVGRARASYDGATYINSTDLKNWVSSGGGAILESTGDSFEPGTTDIIWPGIHELFGYNNCPAIGSSDNAGGGPLRKLIEHPIWDGVSGPVGDSSDGLYDDELNDSCIGTGIKIGTSGSSKQSPMVNEFGSGRTYSGVLVDYTINEDSQKYFLNVVDWVAQGGRERDTTPPVITLIGRTVVKIEVGDNYVDDGATAKDNVDGVVPVVATGTVDINTPGTYEITYTAKDKSSNIATMTRTVEVTEPEKRSGGSATKVGQRRLPQASTPEGVVLGAQTSTKLELMRQIQLQLIKILTLYIELLKKNQIK